MKKALTLLLWLLLVVRVEAGFISQPGSGGASSLQGAATGGRIINDATCGANQIEIGGDAQSKRWKECYDETLGLFKGPAVDQNVKIRIPTNFTVCFWNAELQEDVLCIDPDATGDDKYLWTSGYHPTKNIYVDADATRQAGNCVLADATIPASGYPRGYVTCADITGDEITFGLTMPANYDGGTVTVKVVAVNVNAAPSGTFTLGINGHCTRDGDARSAMNTTGSQDASFTSWAAQNAEEHVTTAAITLNGTCAGGASVDFRARVTAAPAQIADIRVAKFVVTYNIAKGF